MSRALYDGLQQELHHFDLDQLTIISDLKASSEIKTHLAVKAEKVLQNLDTQLSRLSTSLESLWHSHNSWDLAYEQKALVRVTLDYLHRVDVLLALAYEIPALNSHPAISSLLKDTTQKSLDALLQANRVKNITELASVYVELKLEVMAALKTEIALCAAKLSSLQVSMPSVTLPSNLSLGQVLDKLHLSGGSTSSALFFTELERLQYTDLKALEARLEPVHFSMSLLQQQVEDFALRLMPFKGQTLNHELAILEKELQVLLARFTTFKNDSMGARLAAIIKHITHETCERIEALEARALENQLVVSTELFAAEFKFCSGAINLIRDLIKNETLNNISPVAIYNEQVLVKWGRLNRLLEKSEFPTSALFRVISSASTNSSRQIRLSRIFSLQSIPDSEDFGTTPTHGIDLCLDVDPSPAIPYSVMKTDRILDLNLTASELSRSKISEALKQLATTPSDDSQLTAVYNDILNTPCSRPDSPKFLCSPVQLDGDITLVASEKSDHKPHSLLGSVPVFVKKRSRIPVMQANYRKLGLPSIKKRLLPECGPTRIPSIAPTHTVFCSPERRQNHKPVKRRDSAIEQLQTLQARLRSPPVFRVPANNKNVSSSVLSSPVLGDISNTVSRSSSLRADAAKFNLHSKTTPDLSFFKHKNDEILMPISWRSTSPERPGSPSGSRFDERHLPQPLKISKRRWK